VISNIFQVKSEVVSSVHNLFNLCNVHFIVIQLTFESGLQLKTVGLVK
jgi:hypothetical protein